LFYTRRIGKTPTLYYNVADSLKSGEALIDNPSTTKLLNAFKISGRTNNGLGIGVFNAITDNTYATIKDSVGNTRRILTEPFTNYNVMVLDQQLNNYSDVWLVNTNTLRDRNYNGSNVTLGGFTLADKKNMFATDGIYALSQTLVKSDSLANSLTRGHRYYLGVRKISGHFQCGVSHSLTSDTYSQLDLGYYVVPNVETTSAFFSYLWFQPWKGFREGTLSSAVDYTINPMTGHRTQLQVRLDGFANLLSYNAIFFGVGDNPQTNLDYNEPRVAGRFSQTVPFWFTYAGLSSDYRKRFAVDFTIVVGNNIGRFISEGINYNTTLRYRFSDRFTMKLFNRYNVDPYNYGVADYSDTSNIIFGVRRLTTYENVLSGKYIFKNDMALTLNARHYWSTGDYRHYYTLQNDGSTISADSYISNNNFNYNVFNIDLVYSWQFAPGSNLSLVYKNAVETSTSLITVNLPDDFHSTLQAPQLNSFSVKMIYYLDYLYLKKSKN